MFQTFDGHNDLLLRLHQQPENRTVVQVARNLLEGAAYVTRAAPLRSYGAPIPAAAFVFHPRPLQ